MNELEYKIGIIRPGYGSVLLGILNKHQGKKNFNEAVITSYENKDIDEYLFIKEKFKKDELISFYTPNVLFFLDTKAEKTISEILSSKNAAIFLIELSVYDAIKFTSGFNNLLKRYFVYEWVGNVNCYGFSYSKSFRFCVGFSKQIFKKESMFFMRDIFSKYRTRSSFKNVPLKGISVENILNSARRLGYPNDYFKKIDVNFKSVFDDISTKLPPEIYNTIISSTLVVSELSKKI